MNSRVKKRGGEPLAFLYGTAWKEERTESLTRMAIEAGFTGIDTANQRRHYDEAAVGRALARARDSGAVQREDLFVQTKFTFADGHDHRIPYDPSADVQTQVHQSFESSLHHLRTPYVDSYLLHGPVSAHGLTSSDWDAWQTMTDLHDQGLATHLGVSNVTLDQLAALYKGARVKPAFVQNRCFAARGWDRDVRRFCTAHRITYQGFSLLTANRFALSAPAVGRIAQRAGRTPAQVVFRFALQVGMLPLTGTTDLHHMEQDLRCTEFSLSDEEVRAVERIALG